MLNMKKETVILAHGSGGKAWQNLLEEFFLPRLANPILSQLSDSAVLEMPGSRVAFTTDSYVVEPLFFPGGNIGSLAIYGTVNDLAMSGAQPFYISAGFILEEGYSLEELGKIADSMRDAAEFCGVTLATADTKVVTQGKADKIFINTAGIGAVPDGVDISADKVAPGDAIILSGTLGDHGISVLAHREGLELGTELKSDAAPLHRLVADMMKASPHIHCMRDPTRGGLASSLNEIASQSKLGIELQEDKIPIRSEVSGACALLGFDPLYVANEGKLVAFCPSEECEGVLAAMHKNPLGKQASIIGTCIEEHPGIVTMKTRVGGSRIVDMLTGEQLPRIC
jgi:hydrogenase expression/formation protein HypE